MLLPLVGGCFFEEDSGKENLVVVLRPEHGKKIFALPNEIITIYVGLIPINV